MTSAYTVAFTAGVISLLSPCIIPMISVYLTLITGLSQEDIRLRGVSPDIKKTIIINTLAFIAAFTLVFTSAGWAAGRVGELFGRNIAVLNVIGGIFIILMGAKMLGLLDFNLPNLHGLGRFFDSEHSAVWKRIRPLRSFFVGLFFAIACSHCIGPTLYSMLIWAGASGSTQQSMTMMLIFSLGLGLMYLLVAVVIAKSLVRVEQLALYAKTINGVVGSLMIFFGVLMVMNKFQLLTAFFTQILPYKLPFGM